SCGAAGGLAPRGGPGVGGAKGGRPSQGAPPPGKGGDGKKTAAAAAAMGNLDGAVRAITVRGKELFAGGEITRAGERSVNRIARWDGRAWSPLGSGVNGTVRAIAVAGGTVYVGGDFTEAGGAP